MIPKLYIAILLIFSINLGLLAHCSTGNEFLSAQAADELIPLMPPTLPGNVCTDAVDITPLLGQGLDLPQTTELFDNTDYTATDNPTDGFECFFSTGAIISNSIWFKFTGDGNQYRFTTVQCNATEYIDFGETQMALYQGECGNLTPLACNENADNSMSMLMLNGLITFATAVGLDYYLLVDGTISGATDGMGEFCLEVTQVMSTNSTELRPVSIQLFPNPTTGQVQLRDIEAQEIAVFSPQGSLLANYLEPGNSLDLSMIPSGLYYLRIMTERERYIARIVKTD